MNIYISETTSAYCPLLSSMLACMGGGPGASQRETLFIMQEGKPVFNTWFTARLRLLCQLWHYLGLPPDSYTALSLHKSF